MGQFQRPFMPDAELHTREQADFRRATLHGKAKKQADQAKLDLMFWRQAKTPVGRRTLRLVWWILVVQLAIGGIVIGHEAMELSGFKFIGFDLALVTLGGVLLLTVGLSVFACNALLQQIQSADTARAVANGAVSDLVAQRFEDWGLTPSERDVALFTLKGFETHEISELRHSSPGTVRVQLGKIYEKAGVNSRCGFQSLFYEDLLEIPPTDSPQASLPLG